MSMLDTLFRFVVLGVGIIIVLGTFVSAIRSFVLARSARDPITSFVFRNVRKIFRWRLRYARTYARRDAIMAMYAPISLICMPIVWLTFVALGYSLIYWALGVPTLEEAMRLSGSSIMTLGFATRPEFGIALLEFTEAVVGLILTAILISYLPTMYSAFSRRESSVTLLEVRAGSPPSAVEMLTRAYRIRGLDVLIGLWEEWEAWFAEIEESHTSLPALVFFRSVKAERSWVTASGAVLDAAALYASTLDMPRNAQAELCIRAGYLALRYIADFFNIPYPVNVQRGDPISITREEFDEAYTQLQAAGLPMKPDRDTCWLDYAGWRVNYDVVLLSLAELTMAPYAPWSSDRGLTSMRGSLSHIKNA